MPKTALRQNALSKTARRKAEHFARLIAQRPRTYIVEIPPEVAAKVAWKAYEEHIANNPGEKRESDRLLARWRNLSSRRLKRG